MKTRYKSLVSALAFVLLYCTGYAGNYLSPARICVLPNEGKAWILLSTAPAVALIDLKTEKVEKRFELAFTPSDMAVTADGKGIYITEFKAPGKLHLLQAETGKEKAAIEVGAYPSAVCIAPDGHRAWVANRFSNDISVVDLKKKKEEKRIAVIREPVELALSPDGNTLAVANLLPSQSALDTYISAKISLIDTRENYAVKNIALANGTQSIHGLCFSPDGNYLYATHILSRFLFPTTQIERGWMNTNALSIIDMQSQEHYNTMLLDQIDKGAANPRGIAVSSDSTKLYVALAGTHELLTLDLMRMHRELEMLKANKLPGALTSFEELSDNLGFIADGKQRTELKGKGPRYVAEYDGKIYLTDYFSGALDIVVPDSPDQNRMVMLGEEPALTNRRKGELFFNDAALCLQNWQSCISCHPDVRADALNWDLMNDGLGNPKNTKSLLLAHVTPPCMITGIRPNAEIAVRAGIRWIQFAHRSEEDAVCIDEYLKSLKPDPSPLLKNGKPSEAAVRGKAVFEKAGCAQCHYGEYHTDLNKYDVGTGENEYVGFAFDTPTLTEIWRTAPYLYNGRAKTLKEVVTIFNKENKHGQTSGLTEKEIDDLTEYLLSL